MKNKDIETVVSCMKFLLKNKDTIEQLSRERNASFLYCSSKRYPLEAIRETCQVNINGTMVDLSQGVCHVIWNASEYRIDLEPEVIEKFENFSGNTNYPISGIVRNDDLRWHGENGRRRWEYVKYIKKAYSKLLK